MPDGDADVPDGGPPHVRSLRIATAHGTPLAGAPGDALALVVLLTLSDGTTAPAPSAQVTWLSPSTVVAQDPYQVAGASVLPDAGSQPTAFYVRNDYRTTKPGTLFIVDRGAESNPRITVTASVADAGTVTGSVDVLPSPVGEADAGAYLFMTFLNCQLCHGASAGGSPPVTVADGGWLLVDGGPVYEISGQLYSYPAPGLNAVPGSGHLAADPAWTENVFAISAQAGIDNRGVALRDPMPVWAGGIDGAGHTLGAQDFADLYAWLLTQTQ